MPELVDLVVHHPSVNAVKRSAFVRLFVRFSRQGFEQKKERKYLTKGPSIGDRAYFGPQSSTLVPTVSVLFVRDDHGLNAHPTSPPGYSIKEAFQQNLSGGSMGCSTPKTLVMYGPVRST